MQKLKYLTSILLVCASLMIFFDNSSAQNSEYPDPVKNSDSRLMLSGDWVPHDTHNIAFDKLPKVPSEHSIASDVRYAWGTKVHQHSYLVYYDNRYWAMWSDGPGLPREGVSAEKHRDVVPGHDRPGQLVSFSTSKDGENWSEPKDLAGPPDTGFGWIARGFWVRNGKLLALVTRYNAPGYRGKGLQLHAYEMVKSTKECKCYDWKHLGVVADNAMNNFPPKKLPSGEWLTSRRDSVGNVHMLVGGTESFDQWESFSVIDYQDEDLHAEEPYWWVLPDGENLVSLYRDNKGSGYLFRAFSTDNGRTWSDPVRTNFPDARSKFNGVRLPDGRYVLVSNANPDDRDPLTIAISDDGLVFDKMGYLVGGRHVDYPHVIEHNGHIYVTFAGAKQTVEVLKIDISDLDNLDMPPKEELIKK
ncbi:exo-alpha-sialidase [Halalkalibaculum sp. DA384]|uniref:exo-alpha-sialidase n=1 Tax=Halalkalibaculum sp. DA384 TaxID=3373606 RepID=UPI0037551C3E